MAIIIRLILLTQDGRVSLVLSTLFKTINKTSMKTASVQGRFLINDFFLFAENYKLTRNK